MSQIPATFAFGGGLDTNSPAVAVPAGALISGINYEPLAEGYGRIEGYERFDGKTAPSVAQFWTLDFDNGALPIAEGDTVAGATSGATGVVITPPIGFTGSWDAHTAAGTLMLASVSAQFQDNEVITVGGAPHAQADGPSVADSAPSDDLRSTWRKLAIQYHRSIIGKVPGEGPVRGVAVLSGVVYAWRDNIGATKSICYRATAAGWVQLPTLTRVPFQLGKEDIFAEDVITGATSGTSARVIDAVVENGSTTADNATGYLVVADVTGAFYSGERLYVGATDCAEAGVTSTYTLSAGGRYRTINHNFYGAANLYRLYGVNGTGKAFELVPGEGIITIDTGMTDDRPQRVFEINNHLGLIFPGGSVQFSGTLEPRAWSAILGAGEIGFGTNVTDVIQANATAVTIFGEQKIGVLQGTDKENFALDTLTEEAGCDADSAQQIGQTVYIDKRGLRSLAATQAFGNFKAGALSGRFEAYFRSKRKAKASVIGSYVCKTKSQYRLIWDDGTGLSVYMGGKTPEAIPFTLGDMVPTCFGGGELDDGEGMFCGGADGYVYRLDSGNSFDGDYVRGFCMTPFNHFGSGEQDWRFHKVVLELQAPASAHISIVAQFNYGDGENPISGERNFTVSLTESHSQDFVVSAGGGLWDSAQWNEFYWSAPVEGRAECDIDGIGRNASFIFATVADIDEPPHILQAYKVWRSPRRMLR